MTVQTGKHWVTQIITQSYLQRLGIPKSIPETPKMEWVKSPARSLIYLGYVHRLGKYKFTRANQMDLTM